MAASKRPRKVIAQKRATRKHVPRLRVRGFDRVLWRAAGRLQMKLLPQGPPRWPEMVWGVHFAPLDHLGGDYYDFLELPEGRLGLAIGDVSGKGVGAALMMASLEASLRALASVVDDPAELIERVSTLVYEASSANRYATLFYAQYDPGSRCLSYVNAGHNPPAVLRSCGGSRPDAGAV